MDRDHRSIAAVLEHVLILLGSNSANVLQHCKCPSYRNICARVLSHSYVAARCVFRAQCEVSEERRSTDKCCCAEFGAQLIARRRTPGLNVIGKQRMGRQCVSLITQAARVTPCPKFQHHSFHLGALLFTMSANLVTNLKIVISVVITV